jgi:hypothetical protein
MELNICIDYVPFSSFVVLKHHTSISLTFLTQCIFSAPKNIQAFHFYVHLLIQRYNRTLGVNV